MTQCTPAKSVPCVSLWCAFVSRLEMFGGFGSSLWCVSQVFNFIFSVWLNASHLSSLFTRHLAHPICHVICFFHSNLHHAHFSHTDSYMTTHVWSGLFCSVPGKVPTTTVLFCWTFTECISFGCGYIPWRLTQWWSPWLMWNPYRGSAHTDMVCASCLQLSFIFRPESTGDDAQVEAKLCHSATFKL